MSGSPLPSHSSHGRRHSQILTTPPDVTPSPCPSTAPKPSQQQTRKTVAGFRPFLVLCTWMCEVPSRNRRFSSPRCTGSHPSSKPSPLPMPRLKAHQLLSSFFPSPFSRILPWLSTIRCWMIKIEDRWECNPPPPRCYFGVIYVADSTPMGATRE